MSKRRTHGQFGFLEKRERPTLDLDEAASGARPKEGQIVWTDPEKVMPWKYDDRGLKELEEDETFAEVVESVRQWGVLEPLIVRTASDEQKKESGAVYEEVCGFKRLMACRKLEVKAPCIVRDDMSDQEAFSAQSSENRGRTAPSPWSRARSYAMALEEGVFETVDQLAQFCDLNEKTVLNLVTAYRKMPDRMREEAPLYFYGSDTLIALNSCFQKDPNFEEFLLGVIENEPSIKLSYKKLQNLFAQYLAGGEKPVAETITREVDGEAAFSVTKRKSGYSVSVFKAAAKYLSENEVAEALEKALTEKRE